MLASLTALILSLSALFTPAEAPAPIPAPVSVQTFTADDGTLTVNYVPAHGGTVTGYVVLPDGSAYGFDGDRIEEDDPRWNCLLMGNRLCGPPA